MGKPAWAWIGVIMKVSLNWLTDYVDVSMPAGELGELCTRIGLPLEEVIETDTDVVLDIEITSNRPDCLGYIGIAREIAAATGAKFTPPAVGKLPTAGKVGDFAGVEVPAADLCPRYTARVVRGIKVGPSPQWLVERLETVGLRGVNNVVDVTNYVLMEYSQPLHAFDLDKLAGGKIIVRRAAGGETMISIDETQCRLDEDMLIIADAEKPVAIAGVMGGLDTEVTAATTNLLIESAEFDPLSVRRTSRKLQLMSESNYRFERGVDPVAVDASSLRACQLILELAGGTLAEGVIDVWAGPWKARKVTLRPRRTNAVLGLEVPAERQAEILERLGLSPRKQGSKLVCTVPSHRRDLTREIDLIEEIARHEGYDKIPVGSTVTHAVARPGPAQHLRRQVSSALTAGGFDEAQTYIFVDAAEAELFGFAGMVAVDPLVRKTNNALQPTLLPSLLRACKANHDAGNGEVSLFEIAAVFQPGKAGQLPREHVELALLTTGELQDLRGVLEAVMEAVDPAGELVVADAQCAGFGGGAAAEIHIDGERVGVMGCVGEEVLDYYGLERPVSAATVRFEALLGRAGRPRRYQPLEKFPPVRPDLSLIVDEQVTWRQMREAIEAVDQPTCRDVQYVGTYRGKPIPAGKKSLTVTLTYRKPDGTLRSEEVDEQINHVVSALKKKLSAQLRA